jgi:sporulation protein YlmC with PRC-barrel domain
MKFSLLAATAASALLFCQPGAMAQSNSPNQARPTNAEATASQNAQNKQGLRTQVREMLQKDGFTDIQVMTGSLLIRAKDKEGNPIIMNLSPDSLTEVAEVRGAGANDSSNTMGQPNSSGSEFVSIPSSDELSSKVVGLDVYNNENKDIGQIKDIAINPQGRTQAFILSVGGFLGMGEHYVAVNPSNIKVSYNDSDKKWHATMNATADQLKAAPEFKYNGPWNASKSSRRHPRF